jgi:hypothetical protein
MLLLIELLMKINDDLLLLSELTSQVMDFICMASL